MAAPGFRKGRDAPIQLNLNLSDDDDIGDDESFSENGNTNFSVNAAVASNPVEATAVPQARAYAASAPVAAAAAATAAAAAENDPSRDSSVLHIPSEPTGLWDQRMIDMKTRDIQDHDDDELGHSSRNSSTEPPATFTPPAPREPSSLRAAAYGENSPVTPARDPDGVARRSNSGNTSDTSGGKRNNGTTAPRKPGLRNSGAKAPGVVEVQNNQTAVNASAAAAAPIPVPGRTLNQFMESNKADVIPTANQDDESAKAPIENQQGGIILAEATLVKDGDVEQGAEKKASASEENHQNMRSMLALLAGGFLLVIVVIVVVAVLFLKDDSGGGDSSSLLSANSQASPEPITLPPTTLAPDVTEPPTERVITEPPTLKPTPSATEEPTLEPTPSITEEPTLEPTPSITEEPTLEPTLATKEPTFEQTPLATATEEPTVSVTTLETTVTPVSSRPTSAPTASTKAPSNSVPATPAPVSATVAPVPVPATMAPVASTSEVMEWAFAFLPDYTLAALADATTPQSRAVAWLKSDPAFPTMLNWKRTQLFAMATFFYSYNGDDWNTSGETDNWLSSSVDECKWGDTGNEANECNADGRITKINYDAVYRVPGTTPPEVALLTSLETFNVYSHNLFTSMETLLPPQMTNLTSLQSVQLSFNDMSGTIPSYLQDFQHLTNLNIRDNALTGTIPTELGLMTNMRFLNLYGNRLSGTIPTEISALSSLRALTVYANDFTGLVPQQVCSLPLLTTIQVDCEEVSCAEVCGCVCKDPAPGSEPVTTSRPTAAPVVIIDATSPPTVPGYAFGVPEYSVAAIGISTSPQALAYNWVAGHPSLAVYPQWRLQQLFALVAFYYAFNGNLWTSNDRQGWLDYDTAECEWGAFNKCDSGGRLTSLVVGGAAIPSEVDSMPPEMGLLASLKELRADFIVWTADIAGLFPVQLSHTQLDTIILPGNALVGELPSQIGVMTALTNLNLGQNQISGTLPSEFGLLTNMQFLILYDNLFTSSIPSEIGLLTGLESLLIDRTQMTGAIPEEVCSLPSLQGGRLRVDCGNIECSASCDACACYAGIN